MTRAWRALGFGAGLLMGPFWAELFFAWLNRDGPPGRRVAAVVALGVAGLGLAGLLAWSFVLIGVAMFLARRVPSGVAVRPWGVP